MPLTIHESDALSFTRRSMNGEITNASAVIPGGLSVFSASLGARAAKEEMAALRSAVVCSLNQLLDLKDLNTGIHSTRLAEWALHVGGELGLDEVALADLEIAALLHDIGKIGIPDAILNKPARLTTEEYELMKKHPEYGWIVLRQVPGFERASLLILHHHESFDGKGYPAGLKGDEIPLGSRVVSVIDSFDAMVSSRPYRQGLPFEEAARRLTEASGTQFDPRVLRCFLPLARAEMPGVFAAAGTTVNAVV
ncbi:MAG TPA: HD-GYP domain-containing protein [Candidatus Binataceae bacterium]|nr:HD-GYP domain-containing protein [Candidatus Binataceae bacterium]